MPPLTGSPVVDGGLDDPELLFDQHGLVRGTAGTYDIGAVELSATDSLVPIWSSDSDGDGQTYGVEQAFGTDPFGADREHPGHLVLGHDPDGNPQISFGINANPAEGTVWLVKRSTDLKSFTEIYRYDGSSETQNPSVDSIISDGNVQITDNNPPEGRVYYIFEAPVPE